MYVVLVCKEALQRNAIQIWLRLEEKLSAQLTDEVSRGVHRYFYVDSYCGVKRIFQRYALRHSLFYHINDALPSRHLPLKGDGMRSRYFIVDHILFRDGITLIAKH